jgi:hypothetical protein
MACGWRRGLRLLRGEQGGATSFGILTLLVVALLVGFAVDATNLYRHQAILRMSADAAAHAGAAELARGGDAAAAEAAAARLLARNLPQARYGRLIADPRTDLRALAYDPATGRLARPAPGVAPDAVLVGLQRSAAVGNPIPTFVLRLVGVDAWAAGAASVAALLPTRRCGNAGGLFVHGRVVVTPGSRLGEGLCLHGQAGVDLPPAAERAGALHLGTPTQARCSGDCTGLVETNLIMPDTAAHVAQVAAELAEPAATAARAAFFAVRPLDADLEPLAEVGIDTARLSTGSVVAMSPFRFSALRRVPAGLVYLVTCDKAGEGGPSLQKISLVGLPDSAKMTDAALVTTCPFEMDAATRIEGSLVILLHGGTAMLAAAPGAAMGDPARACDARRRSLLMVDGDLDLPATLAASNLAVVTGGDLRLAADPDAVRTLHRGLAAHAGGDLAMAGPHGFVPCPGATDPLLPPLRVIAHVAPPVAGWITPLGPAVRDPVPDMPGQRVMPLALSSGRSGS